jgi:hypothetical protein
MSARKNLFSKLTARLLVAALVATALFAAATLNATPPFQGKFSLPYEVRWGRAILPAGEYRLRVDNVDTVTIVTVQQAESGKTVAMLPFPIRESDKNVRDGSALLIASKGGQRTVHTLKLAELGEVFIYDPSLARGRGTTEEARQTQPVRVLAAK